MSIRDMSDSSLAYYRQLLKEAYGPEGRSEILFDFIQDLIELETSRRKTEARIDAIDPYDGDPQP